MRCLLTLVLLLVTACGGSPLIDGPVTIEVLQKNVADWDGRVVVVDGWLGKCKGDDCGIFESKEAATRVDSVIFDGRIPIGATDEFDRAAEKLQFSRVLLKARINKECFNNTGCKDRADVLQPISLTKWTAEAAVLAKVD
jgi:hypothetical protein